MEGFPNRLPKPSVGNEESAPTNETLPVSPSLIAPIAEELEKRLAEIGPEYALAPDRAEDLNETLKDIGAK